MLRRERTLEFGEIQEMFSITVIPPHLTISISHRSNAFPTLWAFFSGTLLHLNRLYLPAPELSPFLLKRHVLSTSFLCSHLHPAPYVPSFIESFILERLVLGQSLDRSVSPSPACPLKHSLVFLSHAFCILPASATCRSLLYETELCQCTMTLVTREQCPTTWGANQASHPVREWHCGVPAWKPFYHAPCPPCRPIRVKNMGGISGWEQTWVEAESRPGWRRWAVA